MTPTTCPPELASDPGDQAREPRRRVSEQPPPRRQHRPCRDHPERARRAASRPGARGPCRGRGRRRRDHRPSARGPAAHHRRGHRPADGRDRPAAEPGDGGDRGNAGDRARAPAARRLHRPRKARGADDRRRARCRRAVRPAAPIRRRGWRDAGHPRQPVHRAERGAGRRRRCGSARRWSSSTPAAMPMSRARSAPPS